VISTLDVRLRTPPLPTVEDGPWQSQTPSNTLELVSQMKLVLERFYRHVDSSPTSMVEAVKSLSKGAEMMAHALVLSQKRIAELRTANEATTRRKSHKRKRVKKEGTLEVAKGVRLTTLKEFGARSNGKKAKRRARVEVGELS
jgi:hypothetical protein